MTLYATLADVKSEMIAQDTVDATQDAKLLRGIRQISRRIDRIFHSNVPLFAPVIETRRIALDSAAINSTNGTLLFNTPLLSLSGVNVNSQVLVVGTNVQAYPVGSVPYFQLQLLGDAWYSWYTAYCTDVRGVQFASLTGVWGYNVDYAHAWQAADTLAAAITTTTALTFTVADVDGVNPITGESPRISAGHLLQIDAEWMEVTATDTTTNTVTVARGVNGSTPTTHLIATSVSVYSVEDAIKRATVRQVAFQYARRGAYETRRVQDLTAIDFPPDVLAEFNSLLNLFANM